MLNLHPHDRHARRKRVRSAPGLRRRQRGQGLVEFALMSPFLIILMFVIIDFGIGLNHRVVVTNAAREAARYGSTGATAAQIQQKAVDQSEGLVKTVSSVQVAFYDIDKATNPGLNPGDSVSVKITYSYKILTPLPNFVSAFPTSFEMNACTDMRLEQVAVSATAAATGTTLC